MALDRRRGKKREWSIRTSQAESMGGASFINVLPLSYSPRCCPDTKWSVFPRKSPRSDRLRGRKAL
ncbi:hypothetical protein CE91St43_21860 [Oscillospiraceae bacterium]|nr:hypothetical protein CE91St43_21860 [Oscillospiraceae bacterium]